MKVLITGGAGFIGSHLTDRLIRDGHKVVVIDNLSTGKKENLNSEADFYNLDICDFNKIKPLFQGVDFVFHLAAIPRVPVSVEDPVGTAKSNILGTVNVFKAAADAKVKRVIFASSSAIYGDQKTLPFREDMKPNPISPYGLQKLVGEQFAELFTKLYNVPIVSLRYFNCYDEKTEVLTKDGFKYFKNITFTDKIATLNPKIDRLEYKKPLAIQKHKYRGEMFNFYPPGVDLMVTPGHNLYVKRGKNKYVLMEAREVLKEKRNYYRRFKQNCIWRGVSQKFEIIPGAKLEDGRQRREHREKRIPIKIWLKFLGWFLTEGCVFSGITTNYGKKVKYYRVVITQQNKENYKEIVELIKKMGFKPYLVTNGEDIVISSKQLYQHLKKFRNNKHIPKEIKAVDKSLLKLLFGTLMKGDGNKNGRRFTTKYRRFADDFQELLLKIGKVGKVVKENGKICRIYIRNQWTQPFLGGNPTEKKICFKQKKYDGFVYDVTVPNHIIFVRRNGKAVWSGNCYGPRIDFDSDYGLVIGKFLRLRKENKPLTIFGDGEQTRGFCYVDDVIEANIKAAQSEKIKGGEVINISSEKSHSINYLAKVIGGEVKYLPPRPGDPYHTKADITLAKNFLNWEPKISFEEGLKKTQNWFKDL